MATFGSANSPGVTQGTAKDTLLAEYNDIEQVEDLFRNNPEQIAAIMVEPDCRKYGLHFTGKSLPSKPKKNL